MSVNILKKDYSKSEINDINFDYIIVGSGSAGSVLANRLSELDDKNVLLIEAGGIDASTEISMPAACGTCQRGQFDWQYKTTIQPNSHFACENQQGNWPRGKVVGGCSSINYMQYVRGDPNDYNQWNLSEWTFDIMLNYFKKLEKIDSNSILKNEKYRNHNPSTGMISVSMLEQPNQMNSLFIESCVKNNFRFTKDYNAEESLNRCVGFSQISTQNGKRCSTSTNYLSNSLERKNFHLLLNAHVCRVTFDEQKQVKGVIVRRDSSRDKEEFIQGTNVILSAGAIGSPQILLLSGIGPRKQLEKHNIPVILDLPGVGQNLQDHIITPLYYLSQIRTLSTKDLTEENLKLWSNEGKGILTSAVVESQGWTNVNSNDENQIPDIQIHFCPLTVDKSLFENFNYKKEIFEKYFENDLSNGNLWTVVCLPTLLHPKSIGEITLSSNDPLAHPIINPNYLSHQDDVQTLIKSCKLVEKIGQTQPLSDFIRSKTSKLMDNQTFENEDQFWESYIRKYSLTVYHPVGTCKMGDENDSTTVVNQKTQVKGIRGLYVVDASIIPLNISGNTNIPTIAIAERAADLIKTQ